MLATTLFRTANAKADAATAGCRSAKTRTTIKPSEPCRPRARVSLQLAIDGAHALGDSAPTHVTPDQILEPMLG